MTETPKYARINPAELEEIEAEFGRPLPEELALWLIRNRINREAVERMIGSWESDQASLHREVQRLQIVRRRGRKPIAEQKKRCA